MKRVLLGIIGVSLLLCGQAAAAGFGGYLEGARGDGEFEYQYSSDFDVDTEASGFGFVMDTDLSDRGPFNYRLNVGFERLDLEDDFGDTLELEGLVVANTFGFAFVRRPDFRWWAGPQIRIGFYEGELASDPTSDYEMVSFGFGGVTGVNFVTNNVCFSASLGILATGYAGEEDTPGSSRDVDGGTSTAFVNVAFLFGR